MEYINNSKSRIDADLAANMLARLLGIPDPAVALSRYPWLLRDLDRLKGTDVIPPSKMNEWLRVNITALLSQRVSNYNSFSWDTSGTLKEYIKSGKTPIGDLYLNREQLAAAWRLDMARKFTRMGDAEGARDAMRAKPTDKALMDYGAKRGLLYEKGRWFLTGRKGAK